MLFKMLQQLAQQLLKVIKQGIGMGSGMASEPGGVDKGAGTPEEACEEKTVVWKIKNFSEFLEMPKESLNKKGIIFEAGTCLRRRNGRDRKTRTRATWNYFFEHIEGGWVGGFLRLYLDDLDLEGGEVRSARAWHSVSFTSGGEFIPSYTMVHEDFVTGQDVKNKTLFSKEGILEKTKGQGTDELEITIKIKVFSPKKSVLQGPCTSEEAHLISAVDTGNAWESYKEAKRRKLFFAKRDIAEFIKTNLKDVLENST